MANIALIIAGGVGTRMKGDVPKQFMVISEKPVLVWTMLPFQSHPQIDAIYVVCLNGWRKTVEKYKKKYKITKLKSIVLGGNTGFESIRNGLNAIARDYGNDDIVLIHDAVRPMVSGKIISDNIDTVKKYGNAIPCIPCQEAIMQTTDGLRSDNSIPRETLKRTQTPQGFKLGDILAAHKKADEMGITNSIASCTLFTEIGLPIFISRGSEKNIKLTTPEDIDMFRALLKAQNEKRQSVRRIRSYLQRII